MPRLVLVTAWISLTLLESTRAPAETPRPRQPLASATGTVVEAIASAAAENRGRTQRWQGDRLTEHLVRCAARAATTLPEGISTKAYLLGLGIGLDHSDVLQKAPLVSQLMPRAESPAQRRQRLAVLGSPTMCGRRDLAQHFAVSVAMTALLGAQAAEKAGILKEICDAQTGTGFSFADLSANLAGVEFAQRLDRDGTSLAGIAESFQVADFVLDPRDLPEGLSWKDFVDCYGSTEDQRFVTCLESIRRSVLALPGYRDGPLPTSR